MKIKGGYSVKSLGSRYYVFADDMTSSGVKQLMLLNGVGKFLWDLLLEDRTVNQLVDAVLRTYDVEKSTAESDVGEFLSQLKDEGLLEAHAGKCRRLENGSYV